MFVVVCFVVRAKLVKVIEMFVALVFVYCSVLTKRTSRELLPWVDFWALLMVLIG